MLIKPYMQIQLERSSDASCNGLPRLTTINSSYQFTNNPAIGHRSITVRTTRLPPRRSFHYSFHHMRPIVKCFCRLLLGNCRQSCLMTQDMTQSNSMLAM